VGRNLHLSFALKALSFDLLDLDVCNFARLLTQSKYVGLLMKFIIIIIIIIIINCNWVSTRWQKLITVLYR
jgi:hypothetical protein